MESFKKVLIWLDKNYKLIITWLVITILSILYIDRIASFINEKTAITGTITIYLKYSLDVIFFLTIIISVTRFIWLYSKNYVFSKQFIFWLFYLSVTYSTLRFDIKSNIDFLKFHSCSINYADIIFLWLLLAIILLIRNICPPSYNYPKICIETALNKNNSIFQEDIPSNGSFEIYNEALAQSLINKIKDFYPQKAFIISINSGWGDGKTTLLKRIDYLVHKDTEFERKPITFWFNPWKHQDENLILINFFNEFKSALSPFNGNLQPSIDSYLNNIIKIEKNIYTKTLNIINNTFSNSSTFIEDYEKLNNIIDKIGRQIIIFIDDLDRLNHKEINEVLRLLRNVANFKNTIFICGLDKEYVTKQGKLENNFLDKIFNLELFLPKLPDNNLLKELLSLIRDNNMWDEDKKELICHAIYSDKLISIANEFDNKSISIFRSESHLIDINDIIGDSIPEQPSNKEIKHIPLHFNMFFESIRDIKRFYNQLIKNIDLINDLENINLHDYILFQLLISKYSWMYLKFSDRNLQIWTKGTEKIQLKKNSLDLLDLPKNISFQSKTILLSILENIFPKNGNSYYDRSINQRRYLPFYLNNNAFNESFSYPDLVQALEKNEIDHLIKQKIEGHKSKQNLLSDLKNFLFKSENLKNEEHFKSLIKLINCNYFRTITNEDVAYLIWKIEKELKNPLQFFNDFVFVKLDNYFGKFIQSLNLHYTKDLKSGMIIIKSPYIIDNGYDLSSENKPIKIVDKSYTKEKLISLFKSHIASNDISFNDLMYPAINCTKFYFSILPFYILYDEVKTVTINYFKINFKKIFLNNYTTLKAFDGIYKVVFIFSKMNEESLLKWAKAENNKRGMLTAYNKEFYQSGYEEFLKFLNENSSKLNELDTKKITPLIEYIKKQIL